MIYIGIDPGVSGGMAAIHPFNGKVECAALEKMTEREIADWLEWNAGPKVDCFAMLEKVASSPLMGRTSAFTFGRSYGFLRGALAAIGIPFEEVLPRHWQQAMGIPKGEKGEYGRANSGRKKLTRGRAQQLFPTIKVTNAIADALLIASYAQRTHRP